MRCETTFGSDALFYSVMLICLSGFLGHMKIFFLFSLMPSWHFDALMLFQPETPLYSVTLMHPTPGTMVCSGRSAYSVNRQPIIFPYQFKHLFHRVGILELLLSFKLGIFNQIMMQPYTFAHDVVVLLFTAFEC